MEFVPNHLFYLNLFIYLCLPSNHAGLEPVLYEGNYNLYCIAPQIPLERVALEKINISGNTIEIQQTVGPDLVLTRKEKNEVILLELKETGFGPTATQASQANSLLSIKGNHLVQYFGISIIPEGVSRLTYAIGKDSSIPMYDTLQELVGKLKSIGIDACDPETVGISVRADGVYLIFDGAGQGPVYDLHKLHGPEVRVMKLDEITDPRPLYLIPLDPSVDATDEYGRAVLEERVRSSIASLIGSQVDNPNFTITIDEILDLAIKVWTFWRDNDAKKCLRNSVKAHIRLLLDDLRRLGVTINVNQSEISFVDISSSQALVIRKHLSSAGYRKTEVDLWSKAVQLGFTELDDEW